MKYTQEHQPVAWWLVACCALVFAMVVLGGLTRLTHSGLSIVEWQPIVGTLPPLTEAHWQEIFAKYRETPEYAQVNAGMTLEGFKGIFWLEYFHRLLGRLIGIVFFVPFLYFLLKKRLARPLVPKLLAIFALGALQGVVGWYMVKSGLVDDPRVSQYRLALHLALAFAVYAAMLWVALGLLAAPGQDNERAVPASVRRLAWGITAAVSLMIVTGAFVAGIRAGLAYNTFPLMNGRLVPPEAFALEPWWKNFFENVAAVQLTHRAIAWLLAVLVPAFWFLVQRAATSRRVQLLAHALLAALAVQIALGITTLLLAVPVALGVAHQAGALVVFTIALAVNHALRAPPGTATASGAQRAPGATDSSAVVRRRTVDADQWNQGPRAQAPGGPARS